MIKPKKSIRYMVMSVVLITCGFVLTLTFGLMLLAEIISYRELTKRQLTTLGTIVASNITAAVAFDSQNDAYEILSALKAEENIIAACVYDKDGKVLTAFPDNKALRDFPTSDQEGFNFSNGSLEGFVAISQNGKRLGMLYLKRDSLDLYDRLRSYGLAVFIAMSISLLLAVLFSQPLQKKISTPVIALAELSNEISMHHNYSIRALNHSDDEIGSLTKAFNDMLSQIEIQNKQLERAQLAAQNHSLELEVKVMERTAEYRKQKDFAESVINSSLVLITVFDTQMNIIGYNERCEQEFGLKKEDVLGKPYTDAFPNVKDTLTYHSLQRALKGEIVHNRKYKSGVTGDYFESYMVPLRGENDEIYAALMTANNITEIVVASENLENKNEELRRKNEELEQFAYLASHDLQEPLRKIKFFIDRIRTNIEDKHQAENYITKVVTSAERMTSLIKDVLDYSRLSKLEETFSNVDLNLILDNVKTDFELILLQRQVAIKYETLPTVYGNRLQLNQLFSNLISNSIKFCERQPVISISANVVKRTEAAAVGFLPICDYVEIIVSDNGIGFEQHFAEQIFAIFQRLHGREKYEGTGIGLALCKKIVQNHNGHITVTSQPDKGTTFVILLPAATL